MTKLTKEQIEQEQEKFIFDLKKQYCEEFGEDDGYHKLDRYLRRSRKGLFIDICVKKMFREWLARAELDKGE